MMFMLQIDVDVLFFRSTTVLQVFQTRSDLMPPELIVGTEGLNMVQRLRATTPPRSLECLSLWRNSNGESH